MFVANPIDFSLYSYLCIVLFSYITVSELTDSNLQNQWMSTKENYGGRTLLGKCDRWDITLTLEEDENDSAETITVMTIIPTASVMIIMWWTTQDKHCRPSHHVTRWMNDSGDVGLLGVWVWWRGLVGVLSRPAPIVHFLSFAHLHTCQSSAETLLLLSPSLLPREENYSWQSRFMSNTKVDFRASKRKYIKHLTPRHYTVTTIITITVREGKLKLKKKVYITNSKVEFWDWKETTQTRFFLHFPVTIITIITVWGGKLPLKKQVYITYIKAAF